MSMLAGRMALGLGELHRACTAKMMLAKVKQISGVLDVPRDCARGFYPESGLVARASGSQDGRHEEADEPLELCGLRGPGGDGERH